MGMYTLSHSPRIQLTTATLSRFGLLTQDRNQIGFFKFAQATDAPFLSHLFEVSNGDGTEERGLIVDVLKHPHCSISLSETT